MSETRYRCCEHCADEPGHNVETDRHEGPCLPDCESGQWKAEVKP